MDEEIKKRYNKYLFNVMPNEMKNQQQYSKKVNLKDFEQITGFKK